MLVDLPLSLSLSLSLSLFCVPLFRLLTLRSFPAHTSAAPIDEADELRRRVEAAEHECSELCAELSVLRGSSDCDLHSLAAEMRRELEELRRALQNAVAKGESLGQRNAELSEQVEQYNALVHDLRVSAQRGHSALQLASAVSQTLRHRSDVTVD